MTAIKILEKIIACGGECSGLGCKRCPLRPLSDWLCAYKIFPFDQREQLLEAAKTQLTQLILDKMLKEKG